jgi:hypothetical protein
VWQSWWLVEGVPTSNRVGGGGLGRRWREREMVLDERLVCVLEDKIGRRLCLPFKGMYNRRR